ncbi:hypothetical protein [uncultured Algibacter sp.]|uniref:hypothetical protein n=1 Tax=uncultured Algibacter sp. TaxID=298659 RepID=UPI002617FA51|nr:hypothetical protein [uncultured Algibacter sp.]
MVRIVTFQKRESESGEVFYALELEGSLEFVKSQETGKFYATARKTFISSTFTEKTCASLIGTELEGKIQKVKCEPYKYTIPDTNEEVTLTHKYEYIPEEPSEGEALSSSTIDDFVKFENPQEAFSSNGVE